MTNASYDYLTKSDGTTKIKVDAAERDGDGRQISSFYVRKGQLKTVGGSSLFNTTEGTIQNIPFPDITVSTGTSSGSFVKGIAVDGTDKHKLNVTLGNVTYPDISVSDTDTGAIVTDVTVDNTDKHKLTLTRGTVVNNNTSVTWNTSTTIATIAGTAINIKIPANPNTHYTAVPILGASNATSNATSATANTATYLNIIENSTKSGGIQVTGSGGTTVSAVSGKLTITSPSAYTSSPAALGTASAGSSGNWARGDHVHPKPSAADIGAAPTSHAVNASTYGWGSTSVAGHLKVGSNISVTNGTISLTKANVTTALGYTPPETDTTYSAGVGLKLSSNTFSLDGKIIQEDITNTATKTAVTFDLNSYNCSAGTIHGYELAERITGAEASFTGAYGVGNRPSGVNVAFDVSVRLVRWAATNDYTTRQVLWVTGGNTIYYRWCTSGTWGAWTRAYITDNNSDTKVRQNIPTDATVLSTNRPILTSYLGISDTGTGNKDGVAYRSVGMYANLSTNTITASKFVGALEGNVTGNCSGSAGSVAAANITNPTSLQPGVSIASGGSGGTTLAASTLYTLTVGASTCVFKTTPNTWTPLAKGTASAAGTAGYAPAPPAGTQGGTSFLSSAATWVAQTSIAPGVSLAQSGSSGTQFAASTWYTLTVGGSTCTFKTGPNTTYSSKAAASGGTDVSLVTTGEKYTWNNKPSTDTQNTCGAGNSSSKLFLVGRTDQTTGVSNSNQYVYTQSGVLYANSPAPTTKGLRNITLSADAPASSDGANGDIWICPDSTLYQEIEQDGIQGAVANRYAACSTAATTVAKTASIKEGTFTLKQGTRVTVVFTYMNTANSPTLNINGTGGFKIYHRGTQITSGTNKNLLQGACDFVYSGSYWALIGNYIDSVTQVKVGTTAYNPSNGVVSLPAYPTVNNGTLTIKKAVGTSLGTFTANQSGASNISLPPHPIATAYLDYGWAAEANTAYFLSFNQMGPSTGDASDTGYYPGYYALETHSESWVANTGNHIKVLKKGLYNISVNVMSSPWGSSQRNTTIIVYAGGFGLRVYDSGAGSNQCVTGSFCTVLDANAIVYVYYSSTVKCTINDSNATGGEWERGTKLCVELLEDLS